MPVTENGLSRWQGLLSTTDLSYDLL